MFPGIPIDGANFFQNGTFVFDPGSSATRPMAVKSENNFTVQIGCHPGQDILRAYLNGPDAGFG